MNLDPRLSSAPDPPPPPPPQYGGLPYYQQYSTPGSHPSQQPSTSGHSIGTPSNQASPPDAGGLPPQESVRLRGEHGNGEDNAEEAKRPRACEGCRGLKVRCDQDPAHPEIPCKRCSKAGRPCIITQPSRKRQKKADTRVLELEKKLDALSAILQQHGPAGSMATPPMSHAAATASVMQHGATTGAQNSYTPHGPSSTSALSNYPTSGPPEPSTQPPQKRRRTDDNSTTETETLDGADSSYRDAISRYTAKMPSLGDEESKQSLHHGHHRSLPSVSDLTASFYPSTSPEEFVKRINSLITPDMASIIFNRYITKLMPHLPAVVFPPGTTAEGVWRETPILYVCVLSASSLGQLHSDTSTQLAKEAVGAIADCVVRNGAKSLELIQAMQVMAIWYKPPERAEQTNFYQVIHMAAVMALDIGLGRRFNPAKSKRGFGGPNAIYAPGPGNLLPQDSDTLEARRAWLCCYYLCASASMVLRRPNLIRWTNYMKECIEVLESHPDAFPSDKLFCQHVKIQHICEEIGLQFLMDDNTANVSITDPKVSYQLNGLENELKKWKENIPPECQGPQLRFFEHVTSLYLHEIALHFNHNIEDFRLPFTEESLKSVNNTSDTLTQNQMAALEACFKAAHGILETMLSFDIATIKCLPMLIFFVRCIYAMVILIKMHVAITTPGSELGKIMKVEDLRVDYFLDNLISKFGFVTKEEEFRPHPKIIRIFSVLKDWFSKHKELIARQAQGGRRPSPVSRHPVPKPAMERFPTPLDLLSQVASVKQGDSAGQSQECGDWTFPSPYIFDPNRRPPPGHPDNHFPLYKQPSQSVSISKPTLEQTPGHSGPQQLAQVTAGDSNLPLGTDAASAGEFGWGSGFEQAMDMAMGDMDGLSGLGLDGWFMGDSMAPFGFSGDVGAQAW